MSEKICKAHGCDLKHYAKGWCEKHYALWKHHGRLEDWSPTIRPSSKKRGRPVLNKVCQDPSCSGVQKAKGWCRKHYNQLYYDERERGVKGDEWSPTNRPPPKKHGSPPLYNGCKVPDCNGEHCAKGLCQMHYGQWRRDGCPEDWSPKNRHRH